VSNNALPALPGAAPAVERRPPIRRPVLAGHLILALFFGGLGSWAALAPLSGAAVAPGTVRVESHRKTVQHLEGGIIAELKVAEGDKVARDQVLVRLDRTQAQARYEAVRNRYQALKATEARLVAEREGHARIPLPEALLSERDDPRLAEILAGQEQVFDTRRRSFDGRSKILEQRIEQLRSQIIGLEAQVASEERQIELIAEETADVQGLLQKGLERKARLLALQRQAALLDGSRAQHLAEIAGAEQAIGETGLQIFNLTDRFAAEVASELSDVQAQLVDTEEEFHAAQDVLRRQDVRAPIAGTVVNLRLFTPGGVIGPSQPILDIVPRDDALLVEAQVRPLDIDVVKPGLDAQVRLTAFRQRNTPTLAGWVRHVSADHFVDEETDAAHYKAEVTIDAEALAQLDGLELYPGMPAEVLIKTGERTLWDFLVTPVKDSFTRAFREQ
jgi:HlyD family type I secretion membrane fusion protein